jgi:transcriptional regulator with XRE-family HTH domain
MPVINARVVMGPFYAVGAVLSANPVVRIEIPSMNPSPDPPSARPAGPASEALGVRIGRLRTGMGLTQAELAARVAVSRVALSNLESSRSVPGERTVALLAGVFGMEPHELVAGTAYPSAKAERLPTVTARHTEVELQLALMDRDLRWLEGAPPAVAERVTAQWRRDLARLADTTGDARQRRLVTDALGRLART